MYKHKAEWFKNIYYFYEVIMRRTNGSLYEIQES